MRYQFQRLISSMFLLLLVMIWWLPLMGNRPLIQSYSPSVGYYTLFDYGFINRQSNLSAAEIELWTELILPEDNYSMYWNQNVNLSITVTNIAIVAGVTRAFYNFTVHIHSNDVTVHNGSVFHNLHFNGTVPAPAPTGVTPGIIDYPISDGLPGFFLDDYSLANIVPGINITVGASRWNSITYSTFVLEGSEQLCYELSNESVYSTERINTTLRIDQDVGIYYQAEETRTLTSGSSESSLTYYYRVLTTTIPLTPPPNLIPMIIIAVVAIIIIVVVSVLLVRAYWRRRSSDQSEF